MGLSASQARMLSLTSRMSDLELQAQTISNAKLRLSTEGTEASKAYSDALDKQTMTVYSGVNSDGTSSYKDANAYNITTPGMVSATDKQRYIKNQSGQTLVAGYIKTALDSATDFNSFLANIKTSQGSNYDTSQDSYYQDLYTQFFDKDSNFVGAITATDEEMTSSDWLQSQITAGNLFLYTYDNKGGSDGTGAYVNVSWTSGDSSLQEKTNSNDTAKAEAKYETTMADISAKDNRFDLQLKNIDTEHTAVQTEIDSVSKVINKNIERSFKIFDA